MGRESSALRAIAKIERDPNLWPVRGTNEFMINCKCGAKFPRTAAARHARTCKAASRR